MMLIHFLCSVPECKKTIKLEVDDKYRGMDALEIPVPEGWFWEESYRPITGHTVHKLVCSDCKRKA